MYPSKNAFSKLLPQKIHFKFAFLKTLLPQILTFQKFSLEMELPSFEIKKSSYIFPKMKFLNFRKWKPLKTLLTFQEGTSRAQKIKKFTLKKFPLFEEMEFSRRKLKKNSYISGRNFHVPSLKKFLIFFLIVLKNEFIIFFFIVSKK